MIYIPRKIEQSLQHLLRNKEILALIGPRQCGKTTLLQQLGKSLDGFLFLSFEDPDVLQLFDTDIKQFAQTYIVGHPYVVMDEFQYAHHGGKHLKYLYDFFPNSKLIISGSSVIDLTIHALKYLVGRVFVVQLFPFDFEEFLSVRDPILAQVYRTQRYQLLNQPPTPLPAEPLCEALTRYYQEYAQWGGYPRVVLAEGIEEKKLVLKNIYSTYVLRDVPQTLGNIDEYAFINLLRSLALQIGQLISYQELSQQTGLSVVMVKKYLHFLTKTYILDTVKPWFKNKRKEIIKNPKVYFFDTGLRHAIVNDFGPLETRPDRGAVLENTVWMQLIRTQYAVQFWRDKNQAEVDFIISQDNQRPVALEIKWNAKHYRQPSVTFTNLYPEMSWYCGYLTGSLKLSTQTQTSLFLPLL